MSEGLTREVRFTPSYDHRDEHDGRGCGSVIISFNLRGPLGAISAEINTGWMARPYLGTTWPIQITEGPLEPRGNKPGVDLLTGHKSLHRPGIRHRPRLALIQIGMASLDQVMLPYLHVGPDKTLYAAYQDQQDVLQLTAGEAP